MTSPSTPSPCLGGEKPDPFAGTRYRALTLLGCGATGEIYAVEHVLLGKRFAAKLLHAELAEDPRVVDRVRLEAQSLGRLRHPNIVAITGFDRTPQGQPFIVMELLRGETLEAAIQSSGALPLDEATRYALQLLSALEAAHELGILHRDINPRNILLHQPLKGERVLKLLDFGAARVLSGISERAPRPLAVPTKTGTFAGMPEYASPESLQGTVVDGRSDLFQVGLVLHLMLTGRCPHDAPPPSSRPGVGDPLVFVQTGVTSKGAARRRVSQLPPALQQTLLTALAQDPCDRYQSAGEFRRELENSRSAPPPPPSAAERTPPSPAALQAPLAKEGTAATTALRILLFLALAALAAILMVVLGQRLTLQR